MFAALFKSALGATIAAALLSALYAKLRGPGNFSTFVAWFLFGPLVFLTAALAAWAAQRQAKWAYILSAVFLVIAVGLGAVDLLQVRSQKAYRLAFEVQRQSPEEKFDWVFSRDPAAPRPEPLPFAADLRMTWSNTMESHRFIIVGRTVNGQRDEQINPIPVPAGLFKQTTEWTPWQTGDKGIRYRWRIEPAN